MISVINTETNSFRAFGWVQDPSDFRSLCNVVAAFVSGSRIHNLLVQDRIPRLVEEKDGRDALISELTSQTLPLKLSYRALVGTSFTPRSQSRCNGIIQAVVKGQKREFIGDWPADNYVRWAHAFGFLKYNYNDDTFSVTELGEQLVSASNEETGDLSEDEQSILTNAILSYPPAMRVLSLLSPEGAHLTKFEIGKQLGFIGEGGFTSLPQDLLVMELSQTTDTTIRNEMKSDWEGSSDKYARMIARWLCNLGLLTRVPKEICVTRNRREYRETISQAYMITLKGLRSFNAAKGNSSNRRIVKNVYYELFSPSGRDREYLRLRRSYIVKFISENRSTSINQIKEYLSTVNINDNSTTITDDIKGLKNIGLDISISGEHVSFNDLISDFTILIPDNNTNQRHESLEIKERLRERLSVLSHDYLSLVDLSFDGTQNRLFEMKTMDLFVNECGFEGEHLGGSRKPDGIMYTMTLDNNYGVIVDTKAYSNGYNLPISQADEMSRYIRENQNRDERENPNKWWECFDTSIDDFTFLFVSGFFKGRLEEKLRRIAHTTNTDGAALSAACMLICAEMLKKGEIDLKYIRDNMFLNKEYHVK